MNAQEDRRPFSRASLRRIMLFARPHRRRIYRFLLLSVLTALLAVATPLLAGKVVDAIVNGEDTGTVTRLALLIALIAVVEAGLGLLTRWLSATLGEGLILDLRTAVFDHVQKMPVAFFTSDPDRRPGQPAQQRRDRRAAGVQQHALRRRLQPRHAAADARGDAHDLLADHPALTGAAPGVRRTGPPDGSPDGGTPAGGGRPQRRDGHPDDRAVLRPGATLVKLFGRPSDESAEFAARADRVRDIGVRTAMAQSAFITALTLVSALALALVYGLGGFYALRGTLDPGAVVALALLLTRLYAPLTALAGARVEVMSALVSFERVFEILDLKPLIEQKPDARRVPEGPVSVEFDEVSFGYPTAEKVSLASLEEVATLDDRGGTPVLHEVSFRAEPGQTIALVGSSGAGKSTIAQLLPRLYDADAGSVRLNGVDVRDLSADSIRDTLGMVTQDGHLFHESVRANLLIARPDAAEDEIWDALRRSRLDGLIASLPDGLDTVVGERGYRLSGGSASGSPSPGCCWPVSGS